MKLTYSSRAKRDLRAIALWIARDNPQRAISYVQELRDACQALLDYPRAFPELHAEDGRVYHKHVYGPYLILYEVEARTVRVAAVVHGARDLRRLL